MGSAYNGYLCLHMMIRWTQKKHLKQKLHHLFEAHYIAPSLVLVKKGRSQKNETVSTGVITSAIKDWRIWS